MGKTSIIITIVSETFPRQVSKTYHPVILSSDLYMLPINTSTVLLDSSSAREDEAAIDAEVDKAHVIILVYDVNNVECIRRLKNHWLPRIAKANDKVSPSPQVFISCRYQSSWWATKWICGPASTRASWKAT